jgi:hypothetical protein
MVTLPMLKHHPRRRMSMFIFPVLLLLVVAIRTKDHEAPGRTTKPQFSRSRAFRGSTTTQTTKRGDRGWDDHLAYGQQLMKEMREPIGNVEQSKWTDVNDIHKYGWSTRVERNIDYGDNGGSSYMQLSMEQIFKQYGFSKATKDNLEVQVINDRDVTPADTLHPKSMGRFENIFNPAVIIATYNYSPGNVPLGEQNPNVPKEDRTLLKRWWDITFLLWQNFLKENPAGMKQLKCIIRNNISGLETIATIDQAMRTKVPGYYAGGTKDFDDGTWFDMQQDEAAAAILGTPNGQGVAKFLIQHKAQLGLKTIRRIKVYRPDDFEDHAILFELEDVAAHANT